MHKSKTGCGVPPSLMNPNRVWLKRCLACLQQHWVPLLLQMLHAFHE